MTEWLEHEKAQAWTTPRLALCIKGGHMQDKR